MADVGLKVLEGMDSGASLLRGASKRNIGLLGQFIRGAAFKPIKITSLEDFNVIFGGASSSYFGPAIVKSIFDEAGNAPVTLFLARVVGSSAAAATATIALANSKTMTVTAGYKGSQDEGAWANGMGVYLYSFGSRVRNMFSLVITYKDKTEQYDGSTLAEIQNNVNKVSKLITIAFSGEIEKDSKSAIAGTITAATSSNEVNGASTQFTTDLAVGNVLYDGNNALIGTVASIVSDTKLLLTSRALVAVNAASAKKRDDAVYSGSLAGGVDGSVTESDFYPVPNIPQPKGLACFDGVDVQIIGVTEYHSLTMATQLSNYVNDRKKALGVCNLPLNADEGTAELYANALQRSKSFMAGAYLGWATVLDENGNQMQIPAMGPVLGAGFLRTPYISGDFIHIPPAGLDSMFYNVVDMTNRHLSQSTINKLVQEFSCNVIREIENVGFYVGSSRTYSLSPLHQSIHIRLQTSFYLRDLDVKLKFMEQKPRTPELINEALMTLRRYFQTEYDNGALERSLTFEQAYQGICNKSNNPTGQDRKLINIDCLWVPTECTESIRLTLQRNDNILTTAETE